MNSVCVVGKVARAPSVRFEGAGVQVTSLTLVVDETTREGKPYPLYVPCVGYGRSAEACGELHEADLVAVAGRLSWRKQKAKCGEEHSTVVVSVREVVTLQGAAGADTPRAPVGWAKATPTPAT